MATTAAALNGGITLRSTSSSSRQLHVASAQGAAVSISSGLPLDRTLHLRLAGSLAIRKAHGERGRGPVSARQVVRAEYSGRRSGGGAGDFVAGFMLGGLVFGAIGYLVAPMINKSISAEKEIEEDPEGEGEGPPKKLPRFIEEDEGLEQSTRKSLNEKIAQLNAAIDDVSAKLKADDGSYGMNESAVELESPA